VLGNFGVAGNEYRYFSINLTCIFVDVSAFAGTVIRLKKQVNIKTNERNESIPRDLANLSLFIKLIYPRKVRASSKCTYGWAD
jgi:hypothetical protein